MLKNIYSPSLYHVLVWKYRNVSLVVSLGILQCEPPEDFDKSCDMILATNTTFRISGDCFPFTQTLSWQMIKNCEN